MDDQSSDDQLILTSTMFEADSPIPEQFTCKGQNINPPLNISGIPPEAKSLALILHDPDAVNTDFVHWLMWDIPTSASMIAANSVPVGATQGTNSAGGNKYTGPCPPAGTGTHHYHFELYALDKNIGLEPDTNRNQLEAAIKPHILRKTVLTGIVEAPKN
jgi:Raf kinase inhibitor-like YbhB/YbcL family protein